VRGYVAYYGVIDNSRGIEFSRDWLLYVRSWQTTVHVD
jgi:hypothetical protein